MLCDVCMTEQKIFLSAQIVENDVGNATAILQTFNLVQIALHSITNNDKILLILDDALSEHSLGFRPNTLVWYIHAC